MAALAAVCAVCADGAARPNGSAGSIAYARSCAIFTITPEGRDQRRLTRAGTGCDGTPAWSPDGRRIAFVRRYNDPTGQGREFPGEIHVMSANGSSLRRISGRTLDVGDLRWSPDGRSIAFDT